MKRKMNHTKGFTILEVMIALVIFSIGMIGLAGLQGISLQNNQIAYSRTIATQYAYDLADRIRNNPNGTYSTASIPGSQPTLCITSANNCSPSAMAQFDMWEWKSAIEDKNSNLNSPQMFITPAGGNITISIGWNENRDTSVSGTYDCTSTPPSPTGIECVSITVTP